MSVQKEGGQEEDDDGQQDLADDQGTVGAAEVSPEKKQQAKPEDQPAYAIADLIQCGKRPTAVAVNGSLKHLYVLCREEKLLCVLSTITRDILGQITLGGKPAAIATDPFTNRIYVSDAERGLVTVIDGVLLEVTKTIQVGGKPRALAVDAERGKVYVVDSESGAVKVIDGRRLEFEREVQVGLGPLAIAVDPQSGRVVITSPEDNTLWTFVGPTGAELKRIKCPAAPGEVLMEPERGIIYVALPGEGKVMVLDRDKLVLLKTGSNPTCLALDRGRGILFVGDSRDREILLLNTSTNEILQRIPLGESPIHLAFDPSDRSVYVVTQEGRAVHRLAPVKSKPEEMKDKPQQPRWMGKRWWWFFGGALAGTAGFLKRMHGFAQISYEDEQYGGRKTRTLEEEIRFNLGGTLAGGRVGRYFGNVGYKHANIDGTAGERELVDLVYALIVSLFPSSRSPLQLYMNRDVNNLDSDISFARRLATETFGARWAAGRWSGGSLNLFGEQVTVEDALDPATYDSETLRYGGSLQQRLLMGTMLLDYEATELSGNQPRTGERTQDLDFSFNSRPVENLRLYANYQYQDLDRTIGIGTDSESHIGALRADYRVGNRFIARVNLESDLTQTDVLERRRQNVSTDLSYFPVRSDANTWVLRFFGRLGQAEKDFSSPTSAGFTSEGSTLLLTAEHRVKRGRVEITESYGLDHYRALNAGNEVEEFAESARVGARLRPKKWWEIWGAAGLRLRQQEIAGSVEGITESRLESGTSLNISRRFRALAEFKVLFTDEWGRPSPETTTEIDGEWAAHDHRWGWGEDTLRLGWDLRERNGHWSDWWYMRYHYAARFSKLSLTTLDLRQEWRSYFLSKSRLTEARMGFQYNLNKLAMRIEYIHTDAVGSLGRDRNFFFVSIRRTF